MSSQYSEYIPSTQSTESSVDEVIDLTGLRKEAEWVKLSQDPQKCRQLLESLPTQLEDWCLTVKMKGNKINGDGYIQLSLNGANKCVLLHEVVLWSKGEFVRYGEQISHLCSNTKCCNPSHIVSEASEINQSRKNCLVWINCGHSDCKIPYSICQHKPRCIKYCGGYVDENDMYNNVHHNI